MVEITTIEEKISAISRFEDGRFRPTRFKWRGRVHNVREVTGRWADHDGQYKIYYFSVTSEMGDFYEISFHTRDMTWRLDRMMTEQ